MLKCHCLLSVIYFGNIICWVPLHDKISANLHASENLQVYNFNLNKVVVIKELIEIFVLGAMMVNLRPRAWP